jgi:hypothetical protein
MKMKLSTRFKAPDNKVLKSIANVMLYIAAPIGTAAIIWSRVKGLIASDEALEYLSIWASAIGGFKLTTKFSSNGEEQN